jgi:hypothetical protein
MITVTTTNDSFVPGSRRVLLEESKISVWIEHVPELLHNPFIIVWGPASVPRMSHQGTVLADMDEATAWTLEQLREKFKTAIAEIDEHLGTPK